MPVSSLRLDRVLGFSALLVFVAEIIFRVTFHIASPGMAVFYGLAAAMVGHTVGMISEWRQRPDGTWLESFVRGSVTLALLFALLSHFHALRLFPPIVWLLAAGSVVVIFRRRATLRAIAVRRTTLAFLALVFVLVYRQLYLVDRLDLTRATPRAFSWIDTPFWISLARACEHGVPVPDLLFAGESVNYHFGSGLVVASVRALTGLPMQTAYFVTLMSFALAMVGLLTQIARSFLGASRTVAMGTALIGVALLEYSDANLPAVVAAPLVLCLVIELRRISNYRRVLPLIATLLFLMITKEVHYVLAVVMGGWIVAWRFWRSRALAPAVGLGLGVVVTRPLFDLLLRHDQRVHLTVFRDHVMLGWIRTELAHESHWILFGVLALTYAWKSGRPRYALFMGGPFLAYLTGMMLSWFVLPSFDPPMDDFSFRWVLVDMGQFLWYGRIAFGVSVLLCGLDLAVQRLPSARAKLLVGGALLTGLTGYVLLNYFTWTKSSPTAQLVEDRVDDPVLPILAMIPTEGTLIAGDEIHWNGENPYWAAYYGHQFYFLRKGRWATAYKTYASRVEGQRALFTGSDEAAARAVIARDGITHIIMSHERPIPWLLHAHPLAETSLYSVYEVAAGK